MFGIGMPELIIVLILLIPLIFLSKILNKAGFSGWFSLSSLIPLINLIFLWVFAYINWPNIDQKEV